jgi:cell division septation protein DedD
MRLTLLGLGLAALAWGGTAAADVAGDIETLEAAASAHVAAYSALDTERTNLALHYRALVEELTQRLKFGTAPKNPVLVKTLGQALAALAALGNTAEPLATLSAELTDDAAACNALSRSLRAALAGPGADEAGLRPLAARIATASDTLDRALGQALEQRRKQAEMLKAETQDLADLSQAIDTGHLPNGAADPTIADMLAPPSLMDAPASDTHAERRPEPEHGRWVVEFGVFGSEDDAGYIMARLSISGIQSRFMTQKDKHGRPQYKVLTHGFATRQAAESAAAEIGRHDLHPSGVVELPER